MRKTVADAWPGIAVGTNVTDGNVTRTVKRLQVKGVTPVGGGGIVSSQRGIQQNSAMPSPTNVLFLDAGRGGEQSIGETDFNKWEIVSVPVEMPVAGSVGQGSGNDKGSLD